MALIEASLDKDSFNLLSNKFYGIFSSEYNN